MPLLSAVLARLPVGSYPLISVSDRDRLLESEEIDAELIQRGFRLVTEDDPVLLRLRIEQSRPWLIEHPLLVVTRGDIVLLPYDIWQESLHVTLSLPELFPSLAYPVIRQLSPEQLARLARASLPASPIGTQTTIAHVLIHVFNVVGGQLSDPSELVQFLVHLHARGERLPPRISEAVLKSIAGNPDLQTWPLEELLDDPGRFRTFLQEQWTGFVARQQTTRTVREKDDIFDADERLQDQLGLLVRTGMVQPVTVDDPANMPAWSRSGVVDDSVDRRLRRLASAQESLNGLLGGKNDRSWLEWQQIARAWAKLSAFAGGNEIATAPFHQRIDSLFSAWLETHYAPLAGRKLPVPHHVHHVPDYLDFQRRKRQLQRVALIVLDGMSLADWVLIADAWTARHPAWTLNDTLLLAQIPTMTSISRQALVSGLRPIDFAESLDTTSREPARWRAAWERQGYPGNSADYQMLALDHVPQPGLPSPSLVTALCLIDVSVDKRVHGVTMGAAELSSDRDVWLREHSPRLEAVIDRLLDGGYAVWLTSDHGHVVAVGIGAPSEGVLADQRAKRVRIYRDRGLAQKTLSSYDGAVLWGDDGLLPRDFWAVIPPKRTAFYTRDVIIVTHGGATIDEVIVPLVEIGRG